MVSCTCTSKPDIQIKQEDSRLPASYLVVQKLHDSLDATEVFIADLIACSTCFGHHYAHHQELKSIIQWLLRVVFHAVKM